MSHMAEPTESLFRRVQCQERVFLCKQTGRLSFHRQWMLCNSMLHRRSSSPGSAKQPENINPSAVSNSETGSSQEPRTFYALCSSGMGVILLSLIVLLYTIFNSISRFKSSWKYHEYILGCTYVYIFSLTIFLFISFTFYGIILYLMV